MLDEIRSSILIVVLNCFEERLERDLVIDERLLIDDYVILLHIAAKAEHIGNAGHRSQLQFHYPVLNGAQLLSALAATDDLIKIDLSRSGGDGSHAGLKTRRDAILCE